MKRGNDDSKNKQHAIELGMLPLSVLMLPDRDDRRKEIEKRWLLDGDPTFASKALASQAPLSQLEDLLVCVFFLITMGGPLMMIFLFHVLLFLGTWSQVAVYLTTVVLLCFHPLPTSKSFAQREYVVKFSQVLYKYFSYRFVWSGDSWEKARDGPCWIGAAPPHGALPIANVLCMPAINCATREFVGAPASVVAYTPFLRYLLLFGYCPVNASSLTRACQDDKCVGIVPDGIAGIFKNNERDEVVKLKHRKGLAKLAIKQGLSIVPAYSHGNTDAFHVWYDKWGVLETLSRKLRVSLFIPYGRFGLPIPFRCNVTMAFSAPITPVQANEPTQQEIDKLHDQVLNRITECFDGYKDCLGYGAKRIVFV